MLVDPAELARFEAAATRAGARFVERFLADTQASAVARFHRRGDGEADPWHDRVRAIVATEGGDAVLVGYHAGLEHLRSARPDAVVVESREGEVDETYRALVATLD
jgi:hypothetical protein